MLPRIETSDVMRRFTQAFDEHNRNCPVKKHKRQTATGEVEVVRRVGIIPEAVTTTFHSVLSDYIYSYNQVRELMPTEFQNPDDPPSARTNAVRIGKHAGCSDRTVRNHLGRLKKLGFIETKFHGSKNNFELWITRKYLFGMAEPQTPQNAPETAVSGFERKIFPHEYTHGEIKKEQETSNADIVIQHGENKIQGQKGRTETPETPLNDMPVSRRKEIPGGGPRREKSEIVAENDRKRRENATSWLDARIATIEANKPRRPEHLEQKFFHMLCEFWLYAIKVIYPDREFTREQHEKAHAAIMAGVYDNFQQKRTDKQWVEFQAFQMEKIDKAGRYYDRYPGSYKPDPYSIYKPGKGYFDLANVKGFIGIDKWMRSDQEKKIYRKKGALIAKKQKMEAAFALAQEQRQKDDRCEKLLRLARTDFEKLARGYEPRQPIIDRKINTTISLFAYWNGFFATMGTSSMGTSWQEKFYKQYLEQEARDFRPPSYHQPRRSRAKAGDITQETIVYVENWMHDFDYYEPS